MPVTDSDLTSSAQDREQKIAQFLALGHAESTQYRPAQSPGLYWPTPRETSSA